MDGSEPSTVGSSLIYKVRGRNQNNNQNKSLTEGFSFPTELVQQSDDSFLGNGAKVRDLIGSADIHHLFPKKYLQDEGIATNLRYNQVANYVVLSKPVNIVIGAKAPNIYMKEVNDACEACVESKYTTLKTLTDLEANCRMNCIPANFKNMTAADYDTFLEERRMLMAMKIKNYFESL